MPPADYSELAGDEYVVYGKDNDGIWTMVKVNGEHIGKFELLTPWKTDRTYYFGVNYNLKTYYFPKEDLIVTTQNVHTEHELLFVEQEGKWLVLNYDGKTLSVLPRSFTVVKDAKIPTSMWIAVPGDGEHPSCVLYSTTGEIYKKLAPSAWDSLKKVLTTQKEVTETVSIATTQDFETI